MAQQHAVFIGYRREDTADVAGRIYDAFVHRFGRERIFKDVDNIRPGADFGQYIKTVLPKCRVFLALIGPNWVESRDETGARRIDNPHDWVRIEIETALATPRLEVVPVLVNGAHLPKPQELPASLRPLLRRNAAAIRRDPDFHDDVARLSDALQDSVRTGVFQIRSGPRSGDASRKSNASPLLAIAFLGALAAGAFVVAPQFPELLRWLPKADSATPAPIEPPAPSEADNASKNGQQQRPSAPPPGSASGSVTETGAAPPASTPPVEPSNTRVAHDPHAFFGLGDWDRDGNQDIVVRNEANGDLMLYPGESRRVMSQRTPVRIGNGWQGWDFFGLVDYDRDGHQDILIRYQQSGELFIYPGMGGNRFGQRARIGVGWNGWDFFGAGDYDGDGHADIVVRNQRNHELWLYPGEGRRVMSQQQPARIGIGWNGWDYFGMGDWDRDGHLDIVVRNQRNHELWLYPGEGNRVMSQRQPIRIGTGWNGWEFYGMGDWDRDGWPDIVVRNQTNSELWLYPGARGNRFGAPARIGVGW
jgi:hypothetical protein